MAVMEAGEDDSGSAAGLSPRRGTVVLATYNSYGSIGPVLGELDEAARVLARSRVELDVLIVDRQSADRTVESATEIAVTLGIGLTAITDTGTHPSSAVIAGFGHVLDAASSDFIVSLDANGHHDARQITDLVRSHLARRSGLTIGSRWVSGGSSPGNHMLRSAGSRLAGFAVRGAGGFHRVRDATTSFWVVAPDLARIVLGDPLVEPGFAFYSTFIALSSAYGFSVHEVPIAFRPRYSGVDGLNVDDVVAFGRSLGPLRRRVSELRAEHLRDQTEWVERSSRHAEQAAEVGSTFGADTELERLAEADGFFGWIADDLAAHLGRNILEVGAGIGTVTRKLLERRPSAHVTAIEPDPRLFEQLRSTCKQLTSVTALNVTSGDLLVDDERRESFNSVVYVNVLEHIRDDVAELETARDLLVPGGSLAIFVPALPQLYGSLDYKSGHYRRYLRGGLSEVITAAGFDVIDVRYFDVLGVLPYLVMYRLLDVKSLGNVSADGYDRVIVPASRAIQRLVPHPPAGKNLLAIARKP